MKKIDNLFLSVGAMKAGTTWLYEQLKEHPEIHFTPEKEIHYFANKVGIENQLNHRNRIIKLKHVLEKTANANPKFIAKHLEEISWYTEFALPDDICNQWYQNLFRFNKNRKFCADFSNLYCQMGVEGWENVRKVSDNIKVIYTLRDPLERIWSHYKFHMKWVNREDDALEAGFENFKHLLDQHFFWVNAEYAHNYELLQNSLKHDELMLLYFEDFREHPEKTLAEVQKFLGIEEIPANQEKLNKKINKTKSFVMPDEWREYAVKKMSNISVRNKELGISHDKWGDRC
ncbi:sulfotransferase [Leucothrix arctica]|uniref:sulfotransferase n=1 Tax=Leucothrix arctica TaxID=1481894 RepID=UPI001304F534|nr:sulfotransferase [Leucothrix arctica]